MITTAVNMGQRQVYPLIIKVKEKNKTPIKTIIKPLDWVKLGNIEKYYKPALPAKNNETPKIKREN